MVKFLLTLVAVGTLVLPLSAIYPAEDPMLRKIAAVETDSPPKIDGKLDDSCWKQAAQTGDFIQFEPNSGEPATHKTRIYLLYDQNRLYVGFECFKSDMNVLAANSVQRDSFFFSDDHVEVLIDTYLDQRNCYAFALNPLSTQTDRRITNEGGNVRRNSSNVGSAISWDCDWSGYTAQYDDRWTAEFSIPFAELRFPKQNPDAAWGINFWRNDESRQEELSWVELGGRQYAVSQFGHLTGLPLGQLVTKRPLEVKPYGTLKPEKIGDQDPELNTSAGIDVRYPFSSVTFDFTLNPDFAQIEADPDLVNLSDIPLRFPEKRPFFLEGNELFQTPVELFYSRRVEDLVYGGKVVGKLSDYNFAFLSAQAGPENAAFKTKSRFSSDLDREMFITSDLREVFDRNDISLSDMASVAVKDKEGKWLITDAMEEKQYTIIEQGDRLNVYDVDTDHLPADEYNYSVFRVQRELGNSSSIGLLGVNKQGQSLYDRASGIDARFRLPADVNLNLEYAREWRSGIEGDDPISDDIIFAEFSRRANVFSFEARYIDIGENFDVETGFIPRTDRRGVEFTTRYNKQYAGLVQRLRGEGVVDRLYNHAGELTNERYQIRGLIGVKSIFLFSGPEWYYHVDDDGVAYTDRVLNFFTGWFPPKWVRVRNFGTIGIRDDKNTFFIRPEITIRPTAKLDLELTLQRLVEDGVLEQWTRRFAINYQFAQRMFFRSSAEFTIDDERRIFGLFAYEYLPESTFFLVYNNNREKDGETEQIVFVKLAHLLKVGLF